MAAVPTELLKSQITFFKEWLRKKGLNHRRKAEMVKKFWEYTQG